MDRASEGNARDKAQKREREIGDSSTGKTQKGDKSERHQEFCAQNERKGSPMLAHPATDIFSHNATHKDDAQKQANGFYLQPLACK